ncbi:EamA family transporter, partial [Actinoplanes sp. NPDC051633]
MRVLPALAGATGMVCVGGSVAVSGMLAGAPLATVQSLRNAAACLLLLAFARAAAARARARL